MPSLAEMETIWRGKIPGHVISLVWSPGGTNIAAAAVDGPIVILDSDTGKHRLQLNGHEGGTSQIAWHPNQPILASAGCDGQIRIWQASSPSQLASVEAGSAWVETLAWSNRGDYLATAAGKFLRIWDFRQGRPSKERMRCFPPQVSTIASIGWKPGSADVLASCGYNGLSFWSPEAADPVRSFPWKGSMLTLAWSPDAKFIATGNQDSTIQFWNIATGKELQMWGYPSKITTLSWDCRSRYLASGGAATAVVWDCSGKGPANTKPINLDFHSALLSQLAFQPEGSILASGCKEGLVATWRPGKSEVPLATAQLGHGITSFAWSSSNNRLAVGTAAGEVHILRAPRV
jgi:WD40 repeat protein